MTADRSVARNFLALVSGEVLARLVAFVVVIFIARVLGAEGYGVVAFAVSVNLYLSKIADFAIEWVGSRAVAGQRDRLESLVAAIMSVRLVLAVLLTLFAVVLVQWLVPEPERSVLLLYCLTIIPIAASTKWVHMGLEDARPIGYSRVLGELLGLAIVLVAMSRSAALWVPPVAQVASELLVAGYLLIVLRRRGYRLRLAWDLPTALPVFRAGFPLLVHMLLGLFIYNSDLIFLRIFRDSEQVGYYAAAYTLISLLANLGITYGMSLLPTMTRYGAGSAQEQSLYQTALVHVYALCLPISIGGMLLAGGIIGLAFGAQYASSTMALQILIWSIPLSIVRNVPWSGLIARGREDLLLRAITMAALVNVALNLTLIPVWGLLGAAWATVITECLVGSLMLYFASTQGLHLAAARRLLRPTLAALAMALVLWLAGEINLFAGFAIGVAAFGVALLFLGGIRFIRGQLPVLDI